VIVSYLYRGEGSELLFLNYMHVKWVTLKIPGGFTCVTDYWLI
jgi:hypothetical protein